MTVPKINSAHGADTRNIINRAIEVLNRLGIDVQTLVAEGQLTDEQYANLIAIINGMVAKGEISVDDIDKNKGKFDQTYMTDDFLQQMAGDTPINAVPADYSIPLYKTIFAEIVSDNLYNKDAAVMGSVDAATGDIYYLDIYRTSGFIKVEPGQVLKFTHNVTRYGFYDAGRTFVSGEQLSTPITELTIPGGVYNVRVTFYYTNHDDFMVSVGTLPATYEPFQMAIPGSHLTGISGSQLADGSVTGEKTTFFEPGKNMANPDNRIDGYYVAYNDGNLRSNTDYSVFHFIPVIPNTDYTYNFDGMVAFYDSERTYIDGLFAGGTAKIKTLTTPSNAAYASFSTKEPGNFQVEAGSVFTSFEPYQLKLRNELVPVSDTDGKDSVSINLPETLYATVGEEFNIYTANLLKEDADGYNINYNASVGSQLDDRFTFTPEASGTESVTIEVYEEDRLIASRTAQIVVSVARTTPIQVMVIGDSTVRSDGYGRLTQDLIDRLVNNIELVGTMGEAPNLWEGRGGWTAEKYRSGDSYEGVVNPFYNPMASDFDFSHYMSTQGFSGVDVVILQLGINDTFSPTTNSGLETRINEIKPHFERIINSIKSYDASIDVALNITIPPNARQHMFGVAYGTNQTRWRYKYNNHIWVTEMINHFANLADLINTHSSIDTESNIGDGVHPTSDGYVQMASSVYAYLNTL